MLKHIAIALALAGGLVACSPGAVDKTAETTAGATKLDAGNNFGVTATPPSGWYVMDTRVTEELMDAGKQLATSNMDTTTKAAVDASVQRTTNIFGFMKFAPGAPSDENANILALAENVGFMPGITRGSDYFFHVRKTFTLSNMPVEVEDGYQTEKIDGQDFDRMDVTVSIMGNTASQRYYAARKGDHVICFIISYINDADREALETVLRGIKLAW